MLPEREPQQDSGRITFEEVISNAKEIILQDGQFVPTLIVEGSNGLIAAEIPDIPPTHGERLELMRFLAKEAVRSGRVNQLQQVFMVSEAWISGPREDKSAEVRPSDDPNRKEVLIFSMVQLREHKKQIEVLEIIRDSNQKVVGLGKFLPDLEKENESVDVPLLDAFVEGFQAAFRSRFS